MPLQCLCSSKHLRLPSTAIGVDSVRDPSFNKIILFPEGTLCEVLLLDRVPWKQVLRQRVSCRFTGNTLRRYTHEEARKAGLGEERADHRVFVTEASGKPAGAACGSWPKLRQGAWDSVSLHRMENG